MPYPFYKDKLDAAHTFDEAWLQQRKRTTATLSSVWRSMDCDGKTKVTKEAT